MGMGAAPAHAWTISLDDLRCICPKEVVACERVFEEHGYDWNSFALALDTDHFEGVADPKMLREPWESLRAEFKIATTVGGFALALGIGHYCAEDGDRYDDLEEGAYFTVDGVTMFTPAAEKFKDFLKEKSWTVFG